MNTKSWKRRTLRSTKRILSIILSLAMLFSITVGLDFSAYSDALPSSGSCGKNVTYTFDSSTGLLTIIGTGKMQDYTSPYVATPYTSPFFENNRISKIIIKSGVTSIGNCSFYRCTGLTSIIIPDSVTSVGDGAFLDCESLTNITVDSGNTKYDSRNNCNAIIITSANELKIGCKGTVIPKDVSKIGAYAFYTCSLSSLTIPNSVRSIGDYAFCLCKNLKEIYYTGSEAEWNRISIGSYNGILQNVSIIFGNCNHTFDNGKITIQPTCTNTGIKRISCTLCGETKTESVPATGHTYNDGVITTQSTCIQTGIKTYTCTVCEITKTEDIPATGVHIYNVGEITTPPTCTKTGIKTYTCVSCGATETESVPATGHKYNSGEITTQPTCTQTGIKTYTCVACGKTKTESVPATGHTYNNGEITTQATCTQTGVKTFTCANCSAERTETVDALGHNYQYSVTVAPTCTEAGYEKYTCSRCVDSYNIEIEPIGHNFEKKETFAPSYTEDGYSIYKCTGCNLEFTGDIVEQLTFPFDKQISSNNTQTYKIELNKSGILIFDFAGDGYCSIYIYDEDNKFIDSIEAEYNEFFKKSYLKSNSEDSSLNREQIKGLLAGEYYIRIECDGSFEMTIGFQSANETFTKTKDNTYKDAPSAAIIEVNNTYNGFLCDMGDGDTDAYCFEIPEGCGKSKVKFSFSINIFSNLSTVASLVLYKEKSGPVADFYELQSSGGKKATETLYLNEGKYYIAITRVLDSPVQYSFKVCCENLCEEHNYSSKTTKSATCEKNGEKTYTCSICEKTYKETVKALGHKYKTTIKKATPKKSGYVETVCSRCKDEHYKYLSSVSAKLSTTTYTYDGKVKKPKVTVYDENGSTISKDHYTITYPKGRKKIGSYTVKIVLKGKYYSGTINKTFKIVKKVAKPAQVKGVSAVTTADYKNGKITFVAKWKKVKGADGYQIKIGSEDGGGKYWAGTKTIKGGSKIKYTYKIGYGTDESISFIKIRAYKIANGKKVYGKWSKTVNNKKIIV